MKKKFYLPILIGISIALSTTTGHAKPSQHSVKKHTTASIKRVKIKKSAIPHKKTHTSKTHTSIASSKSKHTKTKHHTVLALNKHTHIKASTRQAIDAPHNLATHTINYIDTAYSALPSIKHHVSIENPTLNEIPHSTTNAHGIINSSLSLAGQQAGLSDELIMQLTSIFAWDIDFATNLRQGDQFTVVYEEGLRSNQIIAAEFVNQGRVFTAIRYHDADGNFHYYSPEGRPMRKAFLSTPVDFSRISSGFNAHRKHPILNRIRAHKGVDYAARTGTPVKATGDGNIIFLGNKGAYGRVMIIAHGEHYETLYAHLSDFKQGLQSGDQVTQGEVIAYVGQTGLATGPHLHYEFRVDGEHRNPEKLDLAQATPLNADLLDAFKTQTRPIVAQLYQAKAQNLLAKSQLR